MHKNNTGIAVSESYTGEEVISNLIETARSLVDQEPDQSKEFFEKALILARNIHFDKGAATCLFELGKIHLAKKDTVQAFKLFQESASYFESSGDDPMLYECNSKISDLCFDVGNYGQALEAQLKVVIAARSLHRDELTADALNRTGNIYKAILDLDKAIVHHKEALKIFDALKDNANISRTNFYIGNCYNWKNELEMALSYLGTSLDIADKINDPSLQVKPTGSLAIVLTKLGEFDKATDFFYRSIDYVNVLDDKFLKADLLKNLGDLFIKAGNYPDAVKTLCEALQLGESLKISNPLNQIHQSLAEAYTGMNDFAKALEHYKAFMDLSSRILNEEVALKAKGIQLKYDLEEARREKELAQKSVRLKDQFIARISYEIRTPLNDVLGMANLLADTHPTPEQLEYINTIKLSANNLIFILNDILDYSKIQSGNFRIESLEFNIRNLLSEIGQELKVKADEKKLKVNFSIDDRLPEVIIGDGARLKQILLNLLNNAIKFTDKGKVKTDIQITEVKDTSIKVLFTITDTGIGIAEENINNIFESFTQYASGNPDGSGLGLAIVKQLVDLKGGSISVNSKLGAGSVFKVELPYTLTEPLPETAGPSKAKSNLEVKDLSEMVVLLVEDNKVNQFLAQKLLNKMGFGVVIANNGAEAIELLKSKSFDTILMDVQMPEMNGYELTELIRKTLPDPVNKIPIIALTAYASTQEREKALALGMSDYITKPYSPNELMTALMKQVPSGKKGKTTLREDNIDEVNATMIRTTSDKLIQLFNGNVNDVISLLHMLIVQIPVLLSEAESNINEKNRAATFQSVHKIKSSVNLLKITRLAHLTAELEELSSDQVNVDRIPEVFKKFQVSCQLTVKLLKEEVIRLKKLNQPR